MTNSPHSPEGATAPDNWRAHLLQTPAEIRALLERTHRVAVLGIRPESARQQPSFYVPQYVQRAGLEVVPVPTGFPEVTEILAQPVYRSLAAIPGRVDMVNVFRRPADIAAHVDDIIALGPSSVWFQLGIRNDEAAERLARAGLDVVQDHCMLVELRKLGR